MFGDGKIKMLRDEDGDLYINMWEMASHLANSASDLEEVEGPSDVTETMRVIVWTFCDLALYELGMETLDDIQDVDSLVTLWEQYRE